MAKIFARTLLLLTVALFFNACSWLGFDGDTDAEEAARARRVTAIQNADQRSDAPRGETLADRRLKSVYEKQMDLYERLGEQGDELSDPEFDRLIAEVLTEYQSYLSDYPESAHGFILYAKMLRDIGQRDDANKAFIRANRLDGNIAVVKQQIGNYLAEEGEPALALAYYMAAAELEPNESIYAYQIGELLHTYRDELIANEALEADLLDAQMLEAFARAYQLDPMNRQLRQRYAEAFFDVSQPDWPTALKLWRGISSTATDPFERDWAYLQEARVLMGMGRNAQARQVINLVTEPSLKDAQNQLLRSLPE